MSVPQAIKRGGTAILTCDFDLEGDSLYSVKWYKGNYEFFRYSPKDETPIKVFPMDGLHIDVSDFLPFSKGNKFDLKLLRFNSKPQSCDKFLINNVLPVG